MKTIVALACFIMGTNLYGQQVKSIKITELASTIRQSKTPLIVNFWATFCVPCLQEIPYFQEMADKHKPDGVRIIFVSLDFKESYPQAIIKTAAKHHIYEPIVWLDETNADYFCPRIDSSWSGGMPASLFVNNATGYHKFFEQQLTGEQLEKEIQSMLKER